MKIKELIRELEKYDPESLAVVYSGDFSYETLVVHETKARMRLGELRQPEYFNDPNNIKIVVFS